jgi:UDP-glucuronate decarboxylase
MKRVIFDKKNVLVTGGAGFIGSHLCRRLLETNKVICVDNFLSSEVKNIESFLQNPDFVFIKADINELPDLENLPDLQRFKIQFQGIQEIYNLACPMSPRNFEKNKMQNVLVNSVGMRNVLEAAVKYQSTFVQFSSSVVYGPRRDSNTQIKETEQGAVDVIGERASYDEGKRFAETIASTYRAVHGVDVKIARIFRTFGPLMPLNDQQMLPDFINDALDNKDLVIYGDESFSSSLCYVSDVVDAVTKLAESDTSVPVNIGSDVDVPLKTIAEKIIALTGSSSKIIYKAPIVFMTPLAIPDISLAKAELGWMPVTTLDKGLEKTVDDLRASKGLVGVKQVI